VGSPNQLEQVRLLVLAEAATTQAAANACGHLFEVFVGNLLRIYGYDPPTSSTVNVTSEGIELDVTTTHRLSGSRAIAECKAYARPVKAGELTNFYGKLTVERFNDSDTFGLMVAVPKLTAEGEEKARAISRHDRKFRYLSAESIIGRLMEEHIVAILPVSGRVTSDPAVVITEDGTYSALIELDKDSRVPTRVLCWAASGNVPGPTRHLIESDAYAQNLSVIDVREPAPQFEPTPSTDAHILATVQGSTEDFQYQLPASPKFFVGRNDLTAKLQESINQGGRVFVLNARSGWGKSSLALKLANMVTVASGHALVMDTRTASTPRYVVEVLQKAAIEAETRGLLRLPADASWASLPSALRTLSGADWRDSANRLLVFFDQFENVFRSQELTRSFRDLSMGVRELHVPLIVGFAWKTDLVGWTEGHPYQLRDEIRASARVLVVEPFGSKEVSTLIDRLEKRANAKLVRDLRDRLREYSQGLPWLLKKLSDHVLSELAKGVTQENLLSEALNVQSLFEADLAELTPNQREILSYVARYAPIAASEVTERYNHEAVQSLVDRRLLVQIGDRIDTYWDTFRDYLTTGRVPVEDSYILRQTPNAVARLLPFVMASGGSATVGDLAQVLHTSDNVIFNLSRELRLLGVATYEPLRVRLTPEVAGAEDPETEIRTQIGRSLRRHRAFTTLRDLDEKLDGAVDAEHYARTLPSAFPAVSVTDNTWRAYARVFLGWFEYAGLVARRGGMFSVTPDEQPARQLLLSSRSAMRVRPSVPQEALGPAKSVLLDLAAGHAVSLHPGEDARRRGIRTLAGIGAVAVDSEGRVRVSASGLIVQGQIQPQVLRSLLARSPGGSAGLKLLDQDPAAHPTKVGQAIRDSIGARWTDESTRSIGIYFRAWAKEAGLPIRSARRIYNSTDGQRTLFGG
jgi:hypothetical protein